MRLLLLMLVVFSTYAHAEYGEYAEVSEVATDEHLIWADDGKTECYRRPSNHKKVIVVTKEMLEESLAKSKSHKE